MARCFIPKGLATTSDPIDAPLGINYEVSLSSNKQIVTVKYIATSEQPKAGLILKFILVNIDG